MSANIQHYGVRLAHLCFYVVWLTSLYASFKIKCNTYFLHSAMQFTILKNNALILNSHWLYFFPVIFITLFDFGCCAWYFSYVFHFILSFYFWSRWAAIQSDHHTNLYSAFCYILHIASIKWTAQYIAAIQWIYYLCN